MQHAAEVTKKVLAEGYAGWTQQPNPNPTVPSSMELWPHLNRRRRIVLLPLPLAPTTAQLEPAGTLKETPFSMLDSWRYLGRKARPMGKMGDTRHSRRSDDANMTSACASVVCRKHPAASMVSDQHFHNRSRQHAAGGSAGSCTATSTCAAVSIAGRHAPPLSETCIPELYIQGSCR